MTRTWAQMRKGVNPDIEFLRAVVGGINKNWIVQRVSNDGKLTASFVNW